MTEQPIIWIFEVSLKDLQAKTLVRTNSDNLLLDPLAAQQPTIYVQIVVQ